MSKFMRIEKEENEDGVEYNIFNIKTGEYLGFIEYDTGWKKWVFSPDEMTYYDVTCLKDIIQYLEDAKNGSI